MKKFLKLICFGVLLSVPAILAWNDIFSVIETFPHLATLSGWSAILLFLCIILKAILAVFWFYCLGRCLDTCLELESIQNNKEVLETNKTLNKEGD